MENGTLRHFEFVSLCRLISLINDDLLAYLMICLLLRIFDFLSGTDAKARLKFGRSSVYPICLSADVNFGGLELFSAR